MALHGHAWALFSGHSLTIVSSPLSSQLSSSLETSFGEACPVPLSPLFSTHTIRSPLLVDSADYTQQLFKADAVIPSRPPLIFLVHLAFRLLCKQAHDLPPRQAQPTLHLGPHLLQHFPFPGSTRYLRVVLSPTFTSLHQNNAATVFTMADNLCGPSNPTKGLVAHVDRDNSIQQDRLVTASPAGPSNVSPSLPLHSVPSIFVLP